ncbi:MAG: hypothetical protein L7F77_03550 [Candidatus Magnetominusculus sp. LBB02]|nr:hypothetical protein [Candidatus Magnetominusculus sp. LBB02]
MAKEGSPNGINVVKFGALLVLALVIVVYSILLFTGSFGKAAANAPKKTATAAEIETAKKQIDALLSAKFVQTHTEAGNILTIKIDTDSWKKLSLKERKAFITDLGSKKAVTDTSPVIKIRDAKTGTEYASYEYDRVTLAELEF